MSHHIHKSRFEQAPTSVVHPFLVWQKGLWISQTSFVKLRGSFKQIRPKYFLGGRRGFYWNFNLFLFYSGFKHYYKTTLAKKILIVFYKTAVLHMKNYFFDNHFVQLFQTMFYQKYKILGKEGEIEGRFFKYNYWSSQSLNHSVTRWVNVLLTYWLN